MTDLTLKEYHKQIAALLNHPTIDEWLYINVKQHYDNGWRDPKWTAICIYRDLQPNMNKVKNFAAQLGFEV